MYDLEHAVQLGYKSRAGYPRFITVNKATELTSSMSSVSFSARQELPKGI